MFCFGWWLFFYLFWCYKCRFFFLNNYYWGFFVLISRYWRVFYYFLVFSYCFVFFNYFVFEWRLVKWVVVDVVVCVIILLFWFCYGEMILLRKCLYVMWFVIWFFYFYFNFLVFGLLILRRSCFSCGGCYGIL